MIAKAPMANIRQFASFIAARERHRVGKEQGKAVVKPDPIIAQYRFCNVRRNDDRVTKWVHKHYLTEWLGHADLWFALMVARLFNNEDALADIKKYVIPFKPEDMKRLLHSRASMNRKNFNAAYIVSTAGQRMDKVDYVVNYILTPAWKDRSRIANALAAADTLEEAHLELMGLNGMASFMAAQVLADLKYAKPSKWRDFDTFAASGPGSKRGLNRVYGLDKDAPLGESLFRLRLAELSTSVHKILRGRDWKQDITAQDLQNCLCEFDKWCRVQYNEGARPKQIYKPKGE